MTTRQLTDQRIFRAVYLCSACGRTMEAHPDEDWPEACGTARFDERDDRRLIAPLRDVVIERRPSGIATLGGEAITEVVVDVEHRYVVHSPTGFEVGYGGSGPADLALNILGAFVPAPEAWRLHQHFKWEFIAPLDAERFRHVLPAALIKAWLDGQWAKPR